MPKRLNARRSAFHNHSLAFVRASELGHNVAGRRAALSRQYRQATRPYPNRSTDRRTIPERLRNWLGRARVNIRNRPELRAARTQHANDRAAIERIALTRAQLRAQGIIGPRGFSHFPPLP